MTGKNFCLGRDGSHFNWKSAVSLDSHGIKELFGINERLSQDTALEIWNECNEKLQSAEFTPQSLIKKSNVRFIGTTDDPTSTLKYHQLLKQNSTFETKVVPTFRPDGAMFIERPTFQEWIKNLEDVAQNK